MPRAHAKANKKCFAVLEDHRIAMTADARKQTLARDDPQTLPNWTVRAPHVSQASELCDATKD